MCATGTGQRMAQLHDKLDDDDDDDDDHEKYQHRGRVALKQDSSNYDPFPKPKILSRTAICW